MHGYNASTGKIYLQIVKMHIDKNTIKCKTKGDTKKNMMYSSLLQKIECCVRQSIVPVVSSFSTQVLVVVTPYYQSYRIRLMCSEASEKEYEE